MVSRITTAFGGPARSKLICRTLMILLSFVTLILLIVVVAIGPRYGEWDDDGYLVAAGLAIMAPIWCFVYSTTSFFLHLFRTTYHPGWDVGFDLISWLLQIGWGTTLFPIFFASECIDNPYTLPSYCGNGSVQTQFRAEMAATSFLLVNGLFTFAYFCRACRRTELVRRQQWMNKGRNVAVKLEQYPVQKSKEDEVWEAPPVSGTPPTYSV